MLAPMPRPAAPSHFFVLCVVRREGRYLVVRERDGTFYFPAGGVEPGEGLEEAAARETLEEAGVRVAVRGLFRVETYWRGGRSRWRFLFEADVVGSPEPKSVPDEHGLGARWASPSEIARLPLRDPEVLRLVELFEAGARSAPVELFSLALPG